MKRPYIAVGVFLFLFSPLRSHPQTPPALVPSPSRQLSLADALTRAHEQNPLPQAAAARLRSTDAQVAGAGHQPNPTLALAKPYGSTNTGGFDEGILLTQTLELGGKVRYRTQSAQATRDAAHAGRTAADADLTLAVQTAYVEALRADAETKQAEALLATTQRFADAARIQFDAGDAPRSNVVRSQIEVSRAEQSLLTTRTDRTNRYATLCSLLNFPSDTPLTLTDTLTYTPQTYNLPDLTALALQSRPDILAAHRLRDARAADVRGAKAQTRPDLFVEGRRTSIDRANPGESVRVGVSLPLFDYGRIRADIHSAEALQQEQDAQLRETERIARLEVEIAFREREQAIQLIESFQKGRLARSQEIVEMVQTGYANGANSYLEVIDAQRTYQAEQIDYARALAAFQTATARLQRTVGGKLP